MATPRSTVRLPALPELKIAQRIASLRAEHKLTLRELSAQTGLSESYLNRIERQKNPINIANLEKIAAVFDVSMASFFEPNAAQSPVVVTRATKGRLARFRGRKGFLCELLADEKKGKLMEPLLIDLTSANSSVDTESHAGQEFNYVLQGPCLFSYGKYTTELETGDSVYFDSAVPHVCRPIDGKPANILAVMASADYPLHGDISVLLDER